MGRGGVGHYTRQQQPSTKLGMRKIYRNNA